MWSRLNRLTQPINILVSAEVVDQSWSNLKWLLEKSTSTTMTVTRDTNSEPCPTFDLLNVRNDFSKSRLFFDIGQGGCLNGLKRLAQTAGSALHHFDLDLDASRITWGHAVNSQEKLRKALRGKLKTHHKSRFCLNYLYQAVICSFARLSVRPSVCLWID